MLELCPAGDARVDAVAFESAAQAGDIEAIGEYRGELLPEDRYAPWAQERRERLRLLHLRLLKAAGLWERVLDADPADEEAHRALMRRAVESGDRPAAVRQFDRLCEHLRADLGVGPGDEQPARGPGVALVVGGRSVPEQSQQVVGHLGAALQPAGPAGQLGPRRVPAGTRSRGRARQNAPGR